MSHPNPSMQAHQYPPGQVPNSAFSSPYGSPSPYLSNLPPQQQMPQVPYKYHPSFSPNVHSPVNSPHLSSMSARTMSPVNGRPTNGLYAGAPLPGAMGPPSKPAERLADLTAGPKGSTDINKLEDTLTGTGVNLDEEDRNLSNANYYSQLHEVGKSYGGAHGPALGGGPLGSNFEQSDSHALEMDRSYETADEAHRRKRAEDDFAAGRWAQNPLWDAFLCGSQVEKKLNSYSYAKNIQTSKTGLFYASKDMPNTRRTEVKGHDNARQVIDRGQTVLSTDGEVVGDVMKLVALAAEDRMNGIIDYSGRLSCERRDNSSGIVPDDWKTMATVRVTATTTSQRATNSTASKTLKRTFSQMDEQPPVSTPELASVLQKLSSDNSIKEQARAAKRLKRAKNNPADGTESGPASGTVTPSVVAPAPPPRPPPPIKPTEPGKRSSKKKKDAPERILTPEEREEANKTARLAMGSAGKFGKKYGWLNKSSTTPSTGVMPNRAGLNNAMSSSVAATSGNSRLGASVPPGRRFGAWDENKDQGVHARDVLLMLESDGRAIRTFSKGCNLLEKPERK